jgi:hypothetical protein
VDSTNPQPDEGAANPGGQQKVLRRALTSDSFVEKAGLLVLTVVLSGVAVPIVVNRLNANDADRRKHTETAAAESRKAADIARAKEDAVLRARLALLDAFSEMLLTYETLALDVSWYRTSSVNDHALYEKAYSRYSERVVGLFSTWRVLTSRAQLLAGPDISALMNTFQQDVFANQDTPLTQLHGKNASVKEWEAQHAISEGMLGGANDIILKLGTSMGLNAR